MPESQRIKVAIRGLLVWLVIVAAESLHGTARVMFLQPRVGDFRARQIAVFTGAIIILAIAFLFVRWIGATTNRQLLGVGVLWLVLTLSFEIGMGRLMGFSWSRIASDFNLAEGGLLPIGMVVLTLSPLIAAWLRRAKPASGASQ